MVFKTPAMRVRVQVGLGVWLMRKIWTDSFMTLAWAYSELAAAASSSTMAEFCWVTESS